MIAIGALGRIVVARMVLFCLPAEGVLDVLELDS
jgi:hypothetical protein